MLRVASRRKRAWQLSYGNTESEHRGRVGSGKRNLMEENGTVEGRGVWAAGTIY
jgi:hypothetical protein